MPDPLLTRDPLSALYGSGSGGFSTSTGGGVSTGSNPFTGPYPNRQLPSWLPSSGSQIRELQTEYGNVANNFDTSAYDTAASAMQGHIASTAMSAANNAATEYANRARQAGGSGAGAGLVRAEAQVGAQKAIGESKLDVAKFDLAQREAAASQAAQIASTIGDLRSRYLNSLVSYTTSEDQIAADFYTRNRALDQSDPNNRRGGGGAGTSWNAFIPSGQGIATAGPGTAYNPYTGQNSVSSNPNAGTPWSTNWWGG